MGDSEKILTREEVNAAFAKRGQSIHSWAEAHNFPYDTVLSVLRGRSKARFGIGHNVAVALKLKEGVLNEDVLNEKQVVEK